MGEKEDSVMLTIRLPASMREAFQTEMRKRNVTAAEFMRGKIDEFLASPFPRIPKPMNIDYKELAESYLSGGAGRPELAIFATEDSPLVAAIRSRLRVIPEQEAKNLALYLAVELELMSRRVVLLEECMRKVRATTDAAKLP